MAFRFGSSSVLTSATIALSPRPPEGAALRVAAEALVSPTPRSRSEAPNLLVLSLKGRGAIRANAGLHIAEGGRIRAATVMDHGRPNY